LPGVTIDGTDFFAVHEAAGEIIARARKGGGPALLECKMVRFHGHFEGDAQTYRGQGELEDIRANKDCLKKFAAAVTSAGVISAAELTAIDHDVLGLIERAVTQAKAAPLPTEADLLTDVYVKF
jgi:pyruvate dehydrogenase E1 component alpha subunit